MKKTIIAVICIVLTLALVGCSKSGLKIGENSSVTEGTDFDFKMEIVKETVTPLKAAVRITNNTGLDIESGNARDFSIEVLKNGQWKTIEIEGRANTDEALGFIGESEMKIDWTDIYGELPAGNYRIVKCFFPWAEDGSYSFNNDRFWLTAEFSIE